ncbi:type IV secretory system conjugative DNA transfer family protein [Geothrix rubra]|nr:type IV secretion system DNA-binding domain-containing protein [Geothrix rubra]
MSWAVEKESFVRGVFQNGPLFLGAQAALVILALVLWITWNREPRYVKAGEGRADARFRDVSEEWGARVIEGGTTHTDKRPIAELLVYRSPSRFAHRVVTEGQHRGCHLTLVSFRWGILSGHVFVVGPQGSGKTASLYAPLMHSSLVPWVYQDSKAELPFRDVFPDRPVFGLDVRGHATRSGVWNPLEEIRSAEDFDLLVDYIFPKNPKDPNGWVRDMARVIFGAVLRSKRWESIQQIALALRETRLEPFLAMLDPIYLDTMKEPKSQVPVLQDLVVTLSRWETVRVRSITEGRSTVTLDDFIARGGYIMNCEDSDALKGPVHVFWAMLLGRLRNRPEGASKILLLLDEFGDCGRINNIQRALVLLRSKGVSIVAGIQNLGLLQDVYPQDWKAVMEGFGTRIWLARNLEDELRERLSKALGKFTRRVPPANMNAKETEKEADLMPLDAWGHWSELRVALGRLHGFTYWFPVPIEIPRTPLGEVLPGGDPWADSEAEAKAAAQDAMKAVELSDWCIQMPSAPQIRVSDPEPPTTPDMVPEEDWL